MTLKELSDELHKLMLARPDLADRELNVVMERVIATGDGNDGDLSDFEDLSCSVTGVASAPDIWDTIEPDIGAYVVCRSVLADDDDDDDDLDGDAVDICPKGYSGDCLNCDKCDDDDVTASRLPTGNNNN